MGKKQEKYFDKEAIMKMAKEHGVDKNALFLQTLKNYETVQRSIEEIDQIIGASSELTISKEYVRGRENLYLHPAIKELPKQIDAANKTLDKMLDIIDRLGTPKSSDPFVDFCNS